MKAIVGSFQCEANSFCATRAVPADFDVSVGHAALTRLAGAGELARQGVTVIPSVFASALPSGIVSREAYDDVARAILGCVAANPDVDGIYLFMHGSMLVEGMGSGETALVGAIRELTGPAVPIAVALDFHATLPDAFFDSVNVMHSFRTAPHTDHADTERRAARGLLRCMRQGILPRLEAVRVPILVADAGVTAREPLRAVEDAMAECDDDPLIVSAAFCNGHPWIDFPYAGAVIALSHDGAAEHALSRARAIAARLWEGRHAYAFDTETLGPREAVETALASTAAPVFLMDSGDNTTAGAAGTNTLMLRLLAAHASEDAARTEEGHAGSTPVRGRVLVCGITDAALMEELAGLPLESPWSGRIGRGAADSLDAPVPFTGRIHRRGEVIGWADEVAGKTVLLRSAALDVIVTDVRAAFLSPRHLEAAGAPLRDYRLVVLKMGYLFPELRRHAARSIMALTPGASTNDLATLPYRRLSRPVFPLDQDFDYQPKGIHER